jgi:HEAT repeat protein
MKYTAILILLFVAAGTISPQPPAKSTSAAAPSARSMDTPAEMTAWDTLRQGVADSDATHRKTAIAAIGTIGPNSDAVRLVVAQLKDKDTGVRQTAANTLGEMGSPEAIPALKTALDDKPEVSFVAAKALWNLGDPGGREIFQQVLEGERSDAPDKLHTAIKKKLTPGQMAIMGAQGAGSALLGPGSIAITAIREAVKDTKGDAGAPGRAEAAGVLAKDQDAYALTLLEWALSDQNWAVRLAVAKALGERGDQDAVPKLSALLNDDHHAVRYMAAASMIKLSGNQASASGELLQP